MWRWRPEVAGPALGRVGLGWLEVVGRVVGSDKASAMESLWKVVGRAARRWPMARWPALRRGDPRAARSVGASGPRDSGGSRRCRWP